MDQLMTIWFVFFKGQLLIEGDAQCGYRVPRAAQRPVAGESSVTTHTIAQMDGLNCCAYALDSDQVGSGYQLVDLRASYDYISVEEYRMAGRASQILTWDRDSKFCPRCGGATTQVSPMAKLCPECNREYYPRISPAMIVLIRKGDSVLLVHARNYRGANKGLVAGFLEVGETLEECVHREVLEETGLRIKNLKYFASQPWPYPSGVMIGFTADYESGEIRMQDDELTSCEFYSRDNMPLIPPKLSLAWELINDWLNG